MSIRSTVYPGLEHSLAYDHHVDHLTAQLRQVLYPAEFDDAMKRVDRRVATSPMTRIQALTHEIKVANKW